MASRLNKSGVFCIVVLAALAASGCFGDRDSPNPPTNGEPSPSPPPSSNSDSMTSTNGPAAPPPGIPKDISWNECRGAGGAIPYGNSALMLDQGETPPGWE